MKTGIYVRVSSEEQVRHGYSIRAQIEKLTSYASVKDWEIYDIYKDEGISGKNIEARDELKRMLKDIEDGKVKNVLVFKVDRLTRSVKNLIELVELFQECNCAFNSLMESIDTSSATGRMFLKIIGIFAEFERENLIERVSVGFERKVKEGYTLATYTTSYGYDKAKGDKIQTINPDEALIVKEIFHLYINEKCSMTEISHILNKKNIPTKMSGVWSTKTVKNILTNANYIGNVRHHVMNDIKYAEYNGHHEAIIDKNIFYQAQEKINNMKGVSRTKHPKSDVYFVGILKCAKCGSVFTSKRNYKKYKSGTKACFPSYRCIGYMRGCCETNTISHLKIEEQWQKNIENIQDITEIPTTLDNQDISSSQNCNAEEKQLINESMANLEERIQEITELYVSQKIDFDSYQAMTKIAKDKKQDLEIKLHSLNSDKEQQKFIVTKDNIITNLKQNWLLLNNDERAEFLQKFVKEIEIDVRPIETDGHYNQAYIKNVKFKEF